MKDMQPKEIAKAHCQCRKWMARLSERLSPIDVYAAVPGRYEPLGWIALNGGVQAGANPFALRQELVAQAQMTDESLEIYFSSLLPFALLHPKEPVRALIPSGTYSFQLETSAKGSLGVIHMIHVMARSLWTGGHSPNNGFSYIYLFCCKSDVVFSALRHVFQPPTIGAKRLLRLVGDAEPSMVVTEEESETSRVVTCEPIDDVPGLYIVHEFITQAEHDAIWQELKGPRAASLEVDKLARRRVAHFNRRFYYGANIIGAAGDSVNSTPVFYDWMQKRLRNDDLALRVHNFPAAGQHCQNYDQLTVNFYDYNVDGSAPPGIAHHVDSHSAFDDRVMIVSLGSHTVLEFSRYDMPPAVKVPLGVFTPPRSLILMMGEARYAWTHGIAEKKVDIVSDKLLPLRRADRVSLTWRCARESPHRRADCQCRELCDGE